MKKAALRSGRAENAVQLMAVTKTVGAERINEALRLGVTMLGENRVQEAAEKKPKLTAAPFEFHLIGPLQTNKAKKAVELFDVIQSVDRMKVVQMLDRLAFDQGKKQKCLVEVKISREETKSGVPLADAQYFLDEFARHQNLELNGLMTIGELGVSADETRDGFRALREFFEDQQDRFTDQPILSMGMTDDFEVAIEEGSTMVRIGRGLFGERDNAQR
jgi:pyridoxal phosphate enzyme (YggS family)